MLKVILLLLLQMAVSTILTAQDASMILEKVDQNISSENRIMTSEMTIHGRRISRTITAKTYAEGNKRSFTEYLSPIREQGTKMLKLENQLWIYTPSTDRTIQISGHMLRQSLMGSDLSYEDMMDNRKLTEVYNAEVLDEEVVQDRRTWVLQLTARVQDAAYQLQKVWIDCERYVPLKQEMYAKNGQLLKRTELGEVVRIDGRWFPKTILFKDMLRDGQGTEFRITEIKFDQDIPEYFFSRAALKK